MNGLSRRDVLRLGAYAAAGATGLGSLTACGAVPPKPDPNAPQKRGGVLSHGATGGGLKDTLDPHSPVTNPDIARCRNLYEPLLAWDEDYKIQPALAKAVTPNKDATVWTVELRDDVVFHNGKTMTADDVLSTLARVADPKAPTSGGVELSGILDLKNARARGPYVVELPLSSPYAVLDQLLAEYTVGIIPADFDVANPVGTGAFKYDTFQPGLQSSFLRHDDYWGDPAWVDELLIFDFADDSAKVNALLAGQVQSVDNLPSYLVDSISDQGSSALISETGAWVPFTMRVDVAPFKDNRVRQALRLIADRQQMIDQALNGYGFLGNDLYSPFDPAYAKDLPQREQDLDKAKSLLKQAGQSDLQVELVTSTAVGAGGVESANLFVDHAREAGVDVRLTKADPNTFYGERYLSWPFAQDFWNTRNYIPQVAVCAQKGATYNETHFDDPDFNDLIATARQETDEAKRNQLLQDAQEIEYDTGGYIIWGFKRQVDGYSNLVQGFVPHRYMPCTSFEFRRVSFV
ncbi:ABC transporter substrate-binding protein [Solicola gregarius]|uniref:ABC transporter substrate-binding protein n=1 Tax=Solicola gregarius TaxID=2908642 RepID=A0AA46TLH3_9ACTN|nr:ABC transporter substrate-binding protein [Solicola gregarius]UYM07509.1 ABC transporter substrate-binding protein [Solicola gregarius]